MVRGRVATGARERDEIGDRRLSLDQFRLPRASPPHRDDDHLVIAREQPREVPCHSRLPHALAGSEHRDRRKLERLERGRVEAKVGADVRQTSGERT
jgi:hypothetical protein